MWRKRCECCKFTLKVPSSFMRFRMQWKYDGETGINKQKLRDRVRVYRQLIRHPKYQQLKVEGDLKNCSNSKFTVFPLLQCNLGTRI